MNELLQEGRYRIIRHLGRNDIGAIYEGIDNIFERKVFINQCNYAGKNNLADENKLLKSIKHDSFSTVIDYFAEPHGWFVIMEAEDGKFFDEVLKSEKPEISTVMNWTEQILDGLMYLHLHLPPIFYGDIKPQNIFLTSGGKIKMLSSAILKIRSGKKNAGRPSAEALNYSPLEQIWSNLDSASQKVIAESYDEISEKTLRQPLDARCDIYSFGVLLYQTLTGQLPKNALERSIEMLEENSDPLVSPSAINANVPPEISESVLRALEIKRENRFNAAVLMRQVLRTAFVRIKEREETAAANKQPEAVFQTQESFSLADLNPAVKVETFQKPEIETASDAKIEESFAEETPATFQEFAIVNFAQTEAVNEAETFEADSAEREREFQFEEPAEMKMPEELMSDNNIFTAEDAFKFFDFDEDDEDEVLGIIRTPEATVPAATAPVEIEKEQEIVTLEEEESKIFAAEEEPEVIFVEEEKQPEVISVEEKQPEIISVANAKMVVPEIAKSDYKEDYSNDEISVLFSEAEQPSGSKWKIPVVVLVLLLIGGAFGVWSLTSKPGGNQSEQSISSQTAANPEMNIVSQPSSETPTEANTVAPTPETVANAETPTVSNAETAENAASTEPGTNPIAAQETKPTAKKQAAVKAKPEGDKPQTASAKPAEKKEKKVTVDDLIGDN